ncbi:hypothetical protein LPJ70_003508, partial [Coemansia sp. RSA 2708]
PAGSRQVARQHAGHRAHLSGVGLVARLLPRLLSDLCAGRAGRQRRPHSAPEPACASRPGRALQRHAQDCSPGIRRGWLDPVQIHTGLCRCAVYGAVVWHQPAHMAGQLLRGAAGRACHLHGLFGARRGSFSSQAGGAASIECKARQRGL